MSNELLFQIISKEKVVKKRKVVKKNNKNNDTFLFESKDANVIKTYFFKRYGIDLKNNEFSPNVYENLAKLYKTKTENLNISKGKEHRYQRETITKFDRCKLYV